MKLPLSWLKDYVDIDLPLDQLASTLTMAGLEVEEVRLVGLPMPKSDGPQEFKFTGLEWARDKFVVAQVDEVMPHPNADRLVLCRLQDGTGEIIVLTGAPNLFEYKGKGPLPKPIRVAYAREGAKLYDGHQPGLVLSTLKPAKIRGVDSFSMVCSEKELGISDEHEGVIILDDDAPTGMPLVDYMGDAVFEISILPNMIRNACVVGVARELAAVTGKTLHRPERTMPVDGPSIEGQVTIQITDPDLNPRFAVGLVRDAKPQPSPYKIQRRLRLAGMRPINSIVDATNYVMLELGEPLHAFDYDVLVQRAKGKTPTIITRAAKPGEQLTTLDGVDRHLDDFIILVCDTAGALSLAGVMGGVESEVTENTRNVLLEGATWNFVNIRRTASAQRLNSEAAYRFARNLHPAQAMEGIELGMDRLAAWSGGKIAKGVVDNYPKPYHEPTVELSPVDVRRSLGIELSAQLIADLLGKLEFVCKVKGDSVEVTAPAHRTDIGEGVIGKADLLEEVARLYGYDNIPTTRLADSLPPAHPNAATELKDRLSDLLAQLGLTEVITYRLTAVEREARLTPPGLAVAEQPYVTLQNPLTPERSVMRRSLLSSVLEVLEKNIRLRDRLAFFEIGPVFQPVEGQDLPVEQNRLVLALSGLRELPAWDVHGTQTMDFFDLKGVVEALLDALHISSVHYQPVEDTVFHPGKCAQVLVGEKVIGSFGELHPLVKERFDFGPAPILAADFDLETLLALVPKAYPTESVPTFPPVKEDIAVVVDETLSNEHIEGLIRQTGGKMLADVRLFDIFRGIQIGSGKKSMAYNLTYQAPDRTLTDGEVAQIRNKIVKRLEQELGAKLRS
jgi:phenylalanyl-tRNA synthetase beta chain